MTKQELISLITNMRYTQVKGLATMTNKTFVDNSNDNGFMFTFAVGFAPTCISGTKIVYSGGYAHLQRNK